MFSSQLTLSPPLPNGLSLKDKASERHINDGVFWKAVQILS